MTHSLIIAGTVLGVAFIICGTVTVLAVLSVAHDKWKQEQAYDQEARLVAIAARERVTRIHPIPRNTEGA